MKPLKSRIFAAIFVGAIAAIAFTFWPRTPVFYFELTMRSSLPGFAQLYYDTGPVVNEINSVRLPVEGGNRDVNYRFRLPDGIYSRIRFDPTDRPKNTMILSQLRVVGGKGQLLRAIEPSQVEASEQIARIEQGPTDVSLTTASTGGDAILALELGEPLVLKSFPRPSTRTLIRRFLISFFLASLVAFTVPVLFSMAIPVARRWGEKTSAWSAAHPVRLVLLIAATSTILSCYPVVFFGKSFLSPNNHSHTYLLYGEMPTVPGYKDVPTDDEKGSDMGAAMWYSWPASVVESRALFKYFELPLWNRYNSGGLPLLGQGQSMFGDPLHMLVLLTNGSSASWDLKYLLAKILFAFTLGLCVFHLTKHLPAAAIIAASAPFIGFFSYRYNHPAFFSFCYAPSILLCWFKFADAPRGRATATWLGAMVLANWTVMNSGTVKEAYILLLGMNLCGCLTLLLSRSSVAGKWRKLLQACLAQVFFVLISSPVWLTFLHTLGNSWTFYDAGGAFQLQPSLFIGLFDDIFYRQFNSSERHLDPSANFLILLAVLWFCMSWRRIDLSDRCRGACIVALLALAFAFGIIAPSLIILVPFLRNIFHIDNTFSCVAIICLLVLAGFGIKTFWEDRHDPAFRRIYFRSMACLIGLVALYLGTTEAAQRSTRTFLQIREHIPKSLFFWGYSALLIISAAALPWLGRLFVTYRGRPWPILSLVLAALLLHWRHGMHLPTPFDAYVMNPHQRVELIAESSPALRLAQTGSSEPSRCLGLEYDFFPGYGGAVSLEQIDSADPLLNKHYCALLRAAGVQLLFGGSHQRVVNEQLATDLPVFDMLNVRYYLGHPGTNAETIPSLKRVASLDLEVYESQKVWPRAFFTDHLIAYDSEDEFVRMLKQRNGAPFAAIAQADLDRPAGLTTLLAPPDPANAPTIVSAGEYRLTNNTTVAKVRAPAAGVFVLTEPYIAGDFEVTINGKPAEYFRVNSAFKGVFLPEPGDYLISYRYWPSSFTLSLWMALGGVTLLLLWLAALYNELALWKTGHLFGSPTTLHNPS